MCTRVPADDRGQPYGFDRVAVTELAFTFSVTTETIPRDLDVLNRRGWHSAPCAVGGARRERPAGRNSGRRARTRVLGPEGTYRSGSPGLSAPRVTADRADRLGHHHRFVCAALGGGQKHTIVTNSVPIASQLAQLQNGPVHLFRRPRARPDPGHGRRRNRRGAPAGCTATWCFSAPTA